VKGILFNKMTVHEARGEFFILGLNIHLGVYWVNSPIIHAEAIDTFAHVIAGCKITARRVCGWIGAAGLTRIPGLIREESIGITTLLRVASAALFKTMVLSLTLRFLMIGGVCKHPRTPYLAYLLCDVILSWIRIDPVAEQTYHMLDLDSVVISNPVPTLRPGRRFGATV
jgi:hypothetical protein